MPDPSSPSPRHVLVVADGDVDARAELDASWPGWSEGIVSVVAADGGYARSVALGLAPDVLVGDLDSLAGDLVAAAETAGTTIRRYPPDKDESDTELALLEALRLGAARVTVLGAFGGPRLDHALANLWLLGHPALAGVELTLLSANVRTRLLTAPLSDGRPATRALPGRLGAIVSLLPFGGDALGVTTRGLRYPLRDEPLRSGPARGLSNVRMARDAAVMLRAGRLLVVELPA
jgi:thiamine pyrophosphokinase